MRTVASYLGHASVSMTLDIYADVDPEAKRAAVNEGDAADMGAECLRHLLDHERIDAVRQNVVARGHHG